MKKLYRLMILMVTAMALASCTSPKSENPSKTFDGDFNVTITEVTKTTASFNIETSDPLMEYFMVVYDAPFVDDFIKDEYLVGAIFEEIEMTASLRGVTFAEYMANNTKTGNYSGTVTGLPTDSDHYILVFGVDAANNYTLSSEVKKEFFTTLPAPQSDATFTVETEVLMNSVTFNVKPSDNDTLWHLLTVTKEMYDYYTNPADEKSMTTMSFFRSYLQSEIEQLLNEGYSSEEVVSRLLLKGELSLSAKGLNANTEYVHLIAGLVMDSDGLFIATEPAVGSYMTENAAPSDMTFKITVSDIEQLRACVRIEPSNDTDRYCALIQPWDGHSSAVEVMNAIVNQWGSWMEIMADDFGLVEYTPEKKVRLDAADTDYYVIAFGYDGGVTTAPEMVTFRTLPGGAPEDATFTMFPTEVNAYNMKVEITSSDETIYYVPGIVTPDKYNEEEIIAALNADFDYIFEQSRLFDPMTTISQILNQYYWNGNCLIEASGLTKNAEYMGYICVYDPTTGHIIKTHTFENLATTTEVGKINSSVELVGYYSGDEENGSIFGEPDDTKGYAITVLHYDNFEGATGLYSSMIEGDFTNVGAYPDAQMWGKCQSEWIQIEMAIPYSFYITQWNTVMTAVTYATDNNNNAGPMGRLMIRPTANEKSPIDELAALIDELYPEEQSLCLDSIVVTEDVAMPSSCAEPSLKIMEVEAAESDVVTMPSTKSNRKDNGDLIVLDHIERMRLVD